GFGGDISGCPGTVFDDELLTEPLGQPLTEQARGDVGGAAGGKADNQAHRPRRIGLRPSDARDGRERGRARRQMEKLSTGKFQYAILRGRNTQITAADAIFTAARI